MRNIRLYVHDILTAMIAVQEFIIDVDFEMFLEDDKTSSAVVRKLEIIGEAAKNIPDTIRQNILKCRGSRWQECATNSSMLTLVLTTHSFGTLLRI